MTRRGCLTLAVLTLAAAVTIASEPAEPAAELAQSVQKKYDSIKDFSADFTHVYQGGVLRKQLSEKGHVLIKKPGRMRWEYTTPDEKLFVSDGVKIYSYVPQDKQVVVGTVPPEDQASTPTLFLAGKGNLTRDFRPELEPLPAAMPPGTVALKLLPKSAQQDYDWLVLAVDPATYQIRGLVTVDAQGGRSSFTFTNVKENVGLPDKDFTFKIPRGVDVVSSTPRP